MASQTPPGSITQGGTTLMILRQEFGKRLAQETKARVERKRGKKRMRDNVSGNINITKGQLEDKVAVSETAENTALEWQKISRPLLDGL